MQLRPCCVQDMRVACLRPDPANQQDQMQAYLVGNKFPNITDMGANSGALRLKGAPCW